MRALLLLIAACGVDMGATEQALLAPGSCATLAIPDDGIDDRAAIQLALDTQGCAELSSGTYDVAVSSPRLTSLDRYNLILLRSGRSLRGAGPSTVLRISGDAGQSDLHGVGLTGDYASLSSLLIDTSALTNTEEQTHAAHVTGPATGVSINNVWFVHPERGPTPGSLGGGDCIKVVGYDATPIRSLTIANNHFLKCDRSGISTIGGYRGMTVVGNVFSDTGDQDFDQEGSAASTGLVLSNNVFLLGPNPQGAWAISVAGQFADDVTVTGNALVGRGMFIYNARRVSISNNAIRQTTGIAPTVSLVKTNDIVAIAGNSITRSASAQYGGGGCLLALTHHNSGRPGASTITGNVFRQEGKYACSLNLMNARNVVVSGNSFVWEPETPQDSNNMFVAVATVNGGRADAVSFIGNTFDASASATPIMSGITIGAYADTWIGKITMVGNTATNASSGFRCTGPVAAIVSSGNNWPASTVNACPTGGGN